MGLDREKARDVLIDYDRSMGDADMLPPDALEAALHEAEDAALDALEGCVIPDPRIAQIEAQLDAANGWIFAEGSLGPVLLHRLRAILDGDNG